MPPGWDIDYLADGFRFMIASNPPPPFSASEILVRGVWRRANDLSFHCMDGNATTYRVTIEQVSHTRSAVTIKEFSSVHSHFKFYLPTAAIQDRYAYNIKTDESLIQHLRALSGNLAGGKVRRVRRRTVSRQSRSRSRQSHWRRSLK